MSQKWMNFGIYTDPQSTVLYIFSISLFFCKRSKRMYKFFKINTDVIYSLPKRALRIISFSTFFLTWLDEIIGRF